jgi:hypothetical protein
VNKNIQRLGYFSTWGIIVLTILLVISVLLQFVIVPDRGWVNCRTSYYIIDTSRSFLSDFCGVVYFLQTPLMLILFACIHDYASGSLKIFSRISLSLVISFTVLRTLSYIVELTIRNINYKACEDDCYLYYAHSMIQKSLCSVDAMSMTFFMGLAELFIIPVFLKTNKVEKYIRLTMFIAGIINLTGALMFILDKSGIFNISMLFSYIFFTVITIFLLKFFRQFKSQEVDPVK